MDYYSLKVSDLKNELKNRGLLVSGTKKQLIERLVNFDSQNEKNQGIYTINVKTLIGSYYTIKLEKTKTILDLKNEIQKKNGIEPSKMRLYYLTFGVQPNIGDITYPDGTVGVRLDDDLSLEDQNVNDGAFFELNISLR